MNRRRRGPGSGASLIWAKCLSSQSEFIALIPRFALQRCFSPLHQPLLQILLRRQIELIFLGMNVGAFGKSDFYECIMFFPAKDDADGLVFIVQPNITIEVIDKHLHLAEILMG